MSTQSVVSCPGVACCRVSLLVFRSPGSDGLVGWLCYCHVVLFALLSRCVCFLVTLRLDLFVSVIDLGSVIHLVLPVYPSFFFKIRFFRYFLLLLTSCFLGPLPSYL